MGLGPIQFGGLASGLDTNAIISAILRVEGRPLQIAESRKQEEQSRISLLGTLEGLVKTLQEKIQDLSSTSGSFFAYSVEVANDDIATIALTGSETPTGSHSISVTSLAQASRFSIDTNVADPAVDALGTGNLSFDYDGQSFSIDITAGTTLNSLAGAINSQADGSVTASVVNVATASAPNYKLVLTGEETGLDFEIQSLASSSSSLSSIDEITAASNAVLEVDGLAIERSSNAIADVLEGVSFTLTGTGSTTFGVEVDSTASKEKFSDFIDAYNKVASFINDQSSFSEEEGAGGLLFGDRALSQIGTALRQALFDVDLATVAADTEGFSSISLVGIDLQSDGTLQLDDDTFDGKLAQDLSALANLFTNSTEGVLIKLDDAIDELIKGTTDVNGNSLDGVFDRRRGTLNRLSGRLDDGIERLEFRRESAETSLVRRFANLESLISGLNSQSAFLNSGLAFPK